MGTTAVVKMSASASSSILKFEEKDCVETRVPSLCGSTISTGEVSAFTPTTSLHIDSKGLELIRLPLPPSQLEIAIRKPDGSLAYTSKRSKRCSGNCVLKDSTGTPLISTTYFFGPCREPIISFLDRGTPVQNVALKSRWSTRKQTLFLPNGRPFAWEYAGKRKLATLGVYGVKGIALVLKLDGKVVAALIRNEHTRTPGSTFFSAGNGGELLLGPEINDTDGISEELVIATCLLMLKKECDRRRAVQFMVISGAL